MPEVAKGHNSWSIFSKFIQKLNRSSTHHYQSIHHLLMKYFFKIYSKVKQVVYSSLSVYSSSFKALATIILRYFADKIASIFFSKGLNSGKGHNTVEKRICVRYFSSGIHIRNFKTEACAVLKLCYKSKSMTNGRMDEWTVERLRSNMLLLLRSWGHKKDKSCDFAIAFLQIKTPEKRNLLLKSKVFSFSADVFSEVMQIILSGLPPLS